MSFFYKKQILLLSFVFLALSIFGQIPSKPNPPRLVNDYAQLLSASETEMLEQRLVEFSNSTGVQICIVLTNDLGGYDITQYADELGMNWGVGTKGEDNGVVIVVKPKTAMERGEARISIGYGLEAVIPDATAGQIVDYDMIPGFKKNNYYAGLDSAVTSIMKFASGEYTPAKYKKMHSRKSKSSLIIPLIIIIGIFLLMKKLSGRNRDLSSHGGSNSLFWLFMLSSMSGGGSRGGSSGGGFGGFGGGSFGGGGASGSW